MLDLSSSSYEDKATVNRRSPYALRSRMLSSVRDSVWSAMPLASLLPDGLFPVQAFPFKVSQDHSRLFNAIQSYSRGFEKNIFFLVASVVANRNAKPISPSLSKAAPISSKATQASLLFFPRLPKAFTNVFQGYPKLSKPIQGIFRKKRLFVSCHAAALARINPNQPSNAGMQTKSRPKQAKNIRAASQSNQIRFVFA